MAADEVAGEVRYSRTEVMAKLEPMLAKAQSRREKSLFAASVLFFDFGVFPSAKIVRSFTEQGSSNDIQGDLREFWVKTRSALCARVKAPAIPQELLDPFGSALEALWLKAVERADATYEQARQEAAEQVRSAQDSIRVIEAVLESAKSQIEELRSELLEERRRREASEAQVLIAEDRLRQNTEVSEGLERELEEARASYQGLQEQMSAEAEAARLERDRLIDTHQKEIAAADGARVFAVTQIEAVRQDLERATRATEREREIRQEEVGRYRSRCFSVEDALDAEKKRTAELEGRVSDLVSQVEKLKTPPALPTQVKERKRVPRGAAAGSGRRWR